MFASLFTTAAVRQVIQAGSWGGCYFNPRGGRPGIYGPSVDVTHEEFPADWFEGLADDQYRGRRYEIPRNKYRVRPPSAAAALHVYVLLFPPECTTISLRSCFGSTLCSKVRRCFR